MGFQFCQLRDVLSHNLCQHLLPRIFLVLNVLTELKWNLLTILICIFSLDNIVEHCFRSLLVVFVCEFVWEVCFQSDRSCFKKKQDMFACFHSSCFFESFVYSGYEASISYINFHVSFEFFGIYFHLSDCLNCYTDIFNMTSETQNSICVPICHYLIPLWVETCSERHFLSSFPMSCWNANSYLLIVRIKLCQLRLIWGIAALVNNTFSPWTSIPPIPSRILSYPGSVTNSY